MGWKATAPAVAIISFIISLGCAEPGSYDPSQQAGGDVAQLGCGLV